MTGSRTRTSSVLGVTQIFAFGSTYYLPAVLAAPISADTGWPLGWVVGGSALGLLCAGLVSPRVGVLIDRYGGRPVLSASSIILALGLLCLSLAPGLSFYLGAWLVIGVGMGAGLYDAAFSTLGRLYGKEARSAITTLTLWGGFASTVCWPLSAFLAAHVGWRGACGFYAALQLVLSLPLHALLVPVQDLADPFQPMASEPTDAVSGLAPREHLAVFLCLAAMLTLMSAAASSLLVHLITLLQASGLTLAQAVALGAIFGPAQVAARLVEAAFARHYHPIWTMIVGVVLVAAGMVLLASGRTPAGVALALFGAGNGLFAIARGTTPFALFGARRYGRVMGRLAFPALLAQAASPVLAATLMDAAGGTALLSVLAGLTMANLALVAVLWKASAGTRRVA